MTDTEDQEKSRSTNRDMGTVGGGNIPGGSTSGTTQGATNTSNITPGSEGSSSRGNVDAVAPGEGESVKDSSKETSPAATNTVDKQAGGGGRHPGQPQTAMGDQDSARGRSGEEITEPMSSRAPDKLHQKQQQ